MNQRNVKTLLLIGAATLLGACATQEPTRDTYQIVTEEFMVPAADPGISLYVRNKRIASESQFPAERIVLTGENGTRLLLDFESPVTLHDGDGLVLDNGSVVAVAGQAEQLIEVSAKAPNTNTATCSSRRREPTSTCTTKNAGKQTANVAKNRKGNLMPAEAACAGPE